MSKITLYVIRELTSSFLFIVIMLTSIAWLAQSLKYLELFTSENITASSYFLYILLLLPKIFHLTLPISLFISLLFTLNRMRGDSELIIFWASGKSNRNILIKPIILFSSLLFIIQLLLTILIMPASSLELRNKITEIRSGGIDYNILKEKKFISPVKNLTIFIQDIDKQIINGLLIQDDNNSLKPITYIAEQGIFNYIDGKSSLKLINGFMQILNKESNKISEIEFESYILDLTPYHEEAIKDIYPEEMSTIKLINKVKANKYSSEDYAVLHNRFISPFYIFALALLPLLTFKIIRRPDYRWSKPIMAVSTIAILIKIYEITLSSMFITNKSLIAFSYVSPILITSIIILLLFYEKDIKILKKLNT